MDRLQQIDTWPTYDLICTIIDSRRVQVWLKNREPVCRYSVAVSA